jgi:hypothetical protein
MFVVFALRSVVALLFLQINRFVIRQVTIDRWHQVSGSVAVKRISANIAQAASA